MCFILIQMVRNLSLLKGFIYREEPPSSMPKLIPNLSFSRSLSGLHIWLVMLQGLQGTPCCQFFLNSAMNGLIKEWFNTWVLVVLWYDAGLKIFAAPIGLGSNPRSFFFALSVSNLSQTGIRDQKAYIYFLKRPKRYNQEVLSHSFFCYHCHIWKELFGYATLIFIV